MPNFKIRSSDIEIMDDLTIQGQVIEPTLKELDIINRWLGGNNLSMNVLKKKHSSSEDFTLLDIGCGGGDILKAMAKKYKKAHFIGLDANEEIVKYAQENCKAFKNITILKGDIHTLDWSKFAIDYIHACLFLHHFTHDELVKIFTKAKEAGHTQWIINDLHRHYLAYYSIKWLTRLFSNSYMVIHDAPLSVLRGFNKTELKAALQSSKLKCKSIRWKWAFRWVALTN